MAKKKVVVGMSGGVDSSVAAYLLKEQGYDVIGVTMQIWQDEESKIQEENGGCCGLSAVDDARKVAAQIGIPYYVMNFKKDFQEKVIDYFVDEYLHGRTPNPCIACNRYVKWESLLTRSMEIGADYIATGHYARVEQLPNGRYAIRHSATWSKDQTYALYNLTQDQLRRTLMPVGEYEKDQIREIAKEIVRNDAIDRVLLALDFFDASINRIAAWVIGMRNMQKALLLGLLEPHAALKKMQDECNFTELLATLEEIKTLPFGDVWNHFCEINNVPVGKDWFKVVKDYEKDVLLKR